MMPKSYTTKRVFFAGAGISADAPSRVPLARIIIEDLIGAIAPSNTIARQLLALADNGRGGRLNHGDYIRFELLMEVVQEFLDPSLSVLEFLRQHSSPNALHYLLADRAAKGDVVITTNFDALIEEAALKQGLPPLSICTTSDFRCWRYLGSRGTATVVKIHGSLDRFANHGQRELSSETIGATLKSIAQGITQLALPSAKLRMLCAATQDAEMLVVGYSGADDFDIIPSFHQIAPRKVLWIEHTSDNRLRWIALHERHFSFNGSTFDPAC
jgi:hypothetical protein